MSAKKLQARIQKFGSLLSAMVMPNIGVFIGWGLLTALFIDTGWCPNAYLNELVSPILTYLLPALIGYTAGSNVYGRRGGVIGAFATMGAVVGADVTMLIGGMILGPFAAWVLKKFDKAIDGKVKPGLEMLVDNFSLGIIGFIICIIGYVGVAPIMTTIQNVLTTGVQFLSDHNVLPLSELFVQPAEILFLNNAINHGIMIPLGLQQAAETGKSVLFLVEASGAAWVGLAAAFAVFGNKMAKKSAPGAVIIMFFGGIVEVCFPYCLTMPLTIVGPILGNMFSLFVLTTFGGGTVGPVSPGSVISYLMMTPKDSMVVNIIAYAGSLIISFAGAALMLKLFGQPEEDSSEGGSTIAEGSLKTLNHVIFACDAGMGSSAMGVSILRKKLNEVGLNPDIQHVAVADIPDNADVVITNVSLAERAKMTTGGSKPIITLSNFMDQGEYDRIVSQIQSMIDGDTAVGTAQAVQIDTAQHEKPIFPPENIILNASFTDKKAAIEACADLFITGGYTDKQYKADMIARDADTSVYMGNGVALPHGLSSSKQTIKHSGICFIQVPNGVDFDGETAYLLIGVAGRGEEHVEILGQIAQTLCEESNIDALRSATSKREILNILQLTL